MTILEQGNLMEHLHNWMEPVLGTFKAGRISHLASRILHVISLYNIYLRVCCDLLVTDALDTSAFQQVGP